MYRKEQQVASRQRGPMIALLARTKQVEAGLTPVMAASRLQRRPRKTRLLPRDTQTLQPDLNHRMKILSR